MKLSPVLLKLLTFFSGLLGLLLYLILRSSGVDDKGLLVNGYWAGRGLLVVFAVMAVGLIPLCRTIRCNARTRVAQPGLVGALGAFAGAAALGATAVMELDFFQLMPFVLAQVAAASLLAVGVCHLLGRKPHFLLYVLLCAYFAIRMVNQYQIWNATPQIMEYVFYLAAYVVLMIHAYQYAALDVGLGSFALLWWTGLMSVFLSFVSVSRSSDTWLMLGCGIWVVTNLPRLIFVGRTRSVPPQEEV